MDILAKRLSFTQPTLGVAAVYGVTDLITILLGASQGMRSSHIYNNQCRIFTGIVGGETNRIHLRGSGSNS